MICPKCSGAVQSRGTKKQMRKFVCISPSCHKEYDWRGWFSVEVDAQEYIEPVSILTIDIETSPVLIWNFGLSTPMRRVGLDKLEQDYFVISWSAKWYGKEKVISAVCTPQEALEQNDERIIRELWALLEQPTVVVSHNGRFFDIPKIEDRYSLYGLGPNLPYKLVDTYSVSKRLGSISRKLDYLAGRHFGNNKHDTNFDLWKQCCYGNKKALKRMSAYNDQDVVIGEQIFDFLRVWDRAPLNIGLFNNSDEPVCRSCGGEFTVNKKSFATPMNLYATYRCNECGYCGKLKQSKLTPLQRANLTK